MFGFFGPGNPRSKGNSKLSENFCIPMLENLTYAVDEFLFGWYSYHKFTPPQNLILAKLDIIKLLTKENSR